MSPELAGHEAQEAERRWIGGLEVVEDDQERPGESGGTQERRRRVEELKAGRVGLTGRWCLEIRNELVDLGKHLGDVDGARPQLPAHRVRIGLAHVRPQHLDPRPVRRRARVLPSSAPQGDESAVAGVRRHLVREAALADAGLPSDEDETRRVRPRSRRVRRASAAELGLAAEERRLGRGFRHPITTTVRRRIRPRARRAGHHEDAGHLAGVPGRIGSSVVDEEPLDVAVHCGAVGLDQGRFPAIGCGGRARRHQCRRPAIVQLLRGRRADAGCWPR